MIGTEENEMEGFNINGKILIGIDHGYGNMKTRHTVFKSGVKCYDAEPAIASNVLEYDDKYYVIGESHKVFIANKHEDDDYYILTLTAIAKELSFRGITKADVILAVGLPLNWMAHQKKDFADYLTKKREVEFTFCKVRYHVRISDVRVYPQGYAGIVSALAAYKGVHMLADIGNGTMNTLVITNGRPISDKMYTDKLGVHQCVKRIYNAVQAECGKMPDESLIEDFLRNGTADTSQRILSVMQSEAEKYTAEIFDKLSEYEYDPEMVKLHIIGGGGCLIRNFGTYDTDSVEIISDICATAKGYESLYLTQARARKGA
jgi:plasmid segregation protein ParM